MKLLAVPNDATSAYFRQTKEDFLNEMNPNRIFEEVRFINWKDKQDCEFAGVKSKSFLQDKSQAQQLMQDLITGEIVPHNSSYRNLSMDFPLFRDIFLREKKELKRFLRGFNPDIIRGFNTHFSAELGLILREITGRPLMVSVHDTTRLSRIVNEPDILVCESKELKDICQREYGVSEDKIAVIHNGIDFNSFYPRPYQEINKIIPRQFLNARYKIFNSGRLSTQKNVEAILRAMNVVKKQLPEVKYLHLGVADKHKEKELIRLKKKLGLEDTVYFLGTRPKTQLPVFYSWADVFVFPSRWEGLSRALRESLACGTPAITSNYGSVTEIVQDNKNGLLVNPEDTNAFAYKILQILKNKNLRERLSRNARTSVKRYDIDSSMKLYAKEYQKLIEN